MIIRPFRPGDATGVSILLDTAFEGQAELRLVQALREADQIAVELVAELEGHVVGHICFARLVAPEGWLSLSPLVVSPSQQDRGIGSDLVRAGLDAARQALLESGLDAVKIQPLATRLNLSRTSFYWFFKDRTALLDALPA